MGKYKNIKLLLLKKEAILKLWSIAKLRKINKNLICWKGKQGIGWKLEGSRRGMKGRG